MAKCNSKNKGHKYQVGGTEEFLQPDYDAAAWDINKYAMAGDTHSSTAQNMLNGVNAGYGTISMAVKGFDTANDIIYNLEDPLSENKIYDEALRGTAQDRHIVNQLSDMVAGLIPGMKTSAEKEIQNAINYTRNRVEDYSNVKNIDSLSNVWNPNNQLSTVTGLNPTKDHGRSQAAAAAINAEIDKTNRQNIINFYDQAANINQANIHNAMRNYFQQGGSLDGLNGVTEFNVGGTHQENPYGGIQQGIASDNLPNLVEEGEVKYNDYIYSARLKPSKTLLKDFNLPEKYNGLTFAEVADKLQKESESRPNDPVSLRTLNEMMSRLADAQEEYKAKQAERKLAKMVDNMSTEEKAMLMSSLAQPMMQEQEGIDLGQPMYAKGGKIYIKPSKRGTFTAAAKKHGKSVQAFASQVLAHPENYSPAMRKKANFARNAAKWHSDGGHLFVGGGPYDYPFGALGASAEYLRDLNIPDASLEDTSKMINARLLKQINNIFPQRKTDFMSLVAQSLPDRTQAPFVDAIDPEVTDRKDAIIAAASPTGQEAAREYWNSQHPEEFTNIEIPVTPDTAEGSKGTEGIGSKGIKFNLSNLRYMPAVGAGVAALQAALQDKDFTVGNEYRKLASRLNPMGTPLVGGFESYHLIDPNLTYSNNLALLARQLDSTRGLNPATRAALNNYTIAKMQEKQGLDNFNWQQANNAERQRVNANNLNIHKFNTQVIQADNQLNNSRQLAKLNLLEKGILADDASKQAWANAYNTTVENFWNQLGNVGRDSWNRNQRDALLTALGAEGIKELMKSADGRAWLTSMGYKG